MMMSESDAIRRSADSLTTAALDAARCIADVRGSIIVTGVGKAGLVGQKLVATLASTGSPAHFLHPSEAIHGDLGRIGPNDWVWAISNSGQSEEVLRIVAPARRQAAGLIALTATEDNQLAEAADHSVTYGRHGEIDRSNLAPTASTAVMMAVGDAIAIAASEIRGFRAEHFAQFHPGGSLGRKLSRASDWMRPRSECRLSLPDVSIRDAILSDTKRSGAILITGTDDQLQGIFTDSDLRRLLAARHEDRLDDAIKKHMTSPCVSVRHDDSWQTVVERLQPRRLSELPVIDADGQLVGMIDRSDLQIDAAAVSPHAETPTEPPNGPIRLSVVSPPEPTDGASSTDRSRPGTIER